MNLKYSKEMLDEALLFSKSADPKEKKAGERILREASCEELGKESPLIRQWFIQNTDELMELIKNEQDKRLLWGYIYMLQSFCQRYIRSAKFLHNAEEFLHSPRTKYFEKRAIELVETMVGHKNSIISQAVGSFLWVYGDNRAWDIFLKVLVKKADKNTLSHISIAVSNCHHAMFKEKYKRGYGERIITDPHEMMSAMQARYLLNIFIKIEEKTKTSKRMCLASIRRLREISELLEEK